MQEKIALNDRTISSTCDKKGQPADIKKLKGFKLEEENLFDVTLIFTNKAQISNLYVDRENALSAVYYVLEDNLTRVQIRNHATWSSFPNQWIVKMKTIQGKWV